MNRARLNVRSLMRMELALEALEMEVGLQRECANALI